MHFLYHLREPQTQPFRKTLYPKTAFVCLVFLEKSLLPSFWSPPRPDSFLLGTPNGWHNIHDGVDEICRSEYPPRFHILLPQQYPPS